MKVYRLLLILVSLLLIAGCSVAQPEAVVQEVESGDEFLPIVQRGGTPLALPQSIELTRFADDFDQPLYLTHANDARLFVVERAGKIFIIDNGSRVETAFLDITDRVNDRANERGLLSVAFHPQFASNGQFFVYYTFGSNGDVRISRFTMSDDANVADAASESVVIEIEQPFGNHNGGQLKFGADGYLYAGIGDGGSGGDPQGHGQNGLTLLGSLLRLDVDSAEPYAIPPSNPYIDDSTVADEAFAIGLRNPWRFSFDRANSDLYVADVGQREWEEVNWVAGDSGGGENYGWKFFEGAHCFVDECPDADGFTMPIVEYSHSVGCSITGGYVYRGSTFADLGGIYFYSDFCQGHIWATAFIDGRWQTRQVMDGQFSTSSFGEGADGELYVLDYGGTVYQLTGFEPVADE